MSFTVEDFEDLLRLLYERPDWRNRLREVILPPELFELPRIAQELAEVNRVERERVARLEAAQQSTQTEIRAGFAETGQRLDRVETELTTFRAETSERFDRVESEAQAFRAETSERFNQVDERFDRVESEARAFRAETSERFNQVDEQFGRVDEQFGRVDEQFRQVDERFNQVDERFDGVDRRLDRMDERFDGVDRRLDRMDERFDGVDRRLGILEVRTGQLSADMGDIKGRTLHAGFLHSPLLFDHLLPGAVALSREDLNALLRAEMTAGRLARGDAVRILRTDIVFHSDAPPSPGFLAVEVSWLIDASDVVRAAERAVLLAKTGQPVLAAVAGRRISPDVIDLAARRGVAVIVDEEIDDRRHIDPDA